MSRENVIKQRRNRELMEQGYTECADCRQLVRPGAMICPNCRKLRPAGTQAIVMLVTVIVLVAAASVYYLMPEDGAYVPPSDVPTVLSASPTGLSVSTATRVIS